QEILPAERLITTVYRLGAFHVASETGRYRPCQTQEDAEAREGLLRPAQEYDPRRQGSGRSRRAICLSRPQEPEAQLPGPVDPAHQRCRPPARPDLWSIY